MARILFTVWPYAGCLHPQIAVARALVARGHTVAFYTGQRAVPLVRDLGFDHFGFCESLDREVDDFLLSPLGISRLWRAPWRRPALLRRFLIDTVPQQVADLESVMSCWVPDAIVAEPAMLGPMLILYDTADVPVIRLEYSFCDLPGSDVPPFGLGMLPPRTAPQRIQTAIGRRVLDFATADLKRAASEMRRRHGLSPLDGPISNLVAQLPLIIVPSCREFDFDRREVPGNVKYVGACLWYPDGGALPLLDRTKPVVHVTEGTLYAQRASLLRVAVAGLADLPVTVVMATGRQRTAELVDLGRTARNVVVTEWVSYPDLLPRTDVVVTIGGGGTVIGALQYGIPLVISPTIWDQPDNAARVVAAGAGVRIAPAACTPQRLRRAVIRVLENHEYRIHARRLAACLARHPGPMGAADLIAGVATGAGATVRSDITRRNVLDTTLSVG